MRSLCFLYMPFTQMRESSIATRNDLVQMREPRRSVMT
jgi:hypothetical protein